MSKTTKKLGKPLYTLYLRGEADIKPSFKLVKNWERLDKYAQEDYGKPYDALTDTQKVQVHFNINSGVYREREKQAAAYIESAKKAGELTDNAEPKSE